MTQKPRVYAYFDGSNFYHLCKENYGNVRISFSKISNNMLLGEEQILKINYFTAPVSQQTKPLVYAEQQKFFDKLKKEGVEIYFGRLVKRKLDKIKFICPACGIVQAESFECPNCLRRVEAKEITKVAEKGVDIKLALQLLIDAIEDKYNVALLFSSDTDFVPVIEHIIKKLNKKIIFCRFPRPYGTELSEICSDTRMISNRIIRLSKA
jgi:uncharacterized LabA/DUF88 family protein